MKFKNLYTILPEAKKEALTKSTTKNSGSPNKLGACYNFKQARIEFATNNLSLLKRNVNLY